MMISIIIAKIIAKILRLLHKGATSLPGKIALNIKPNLLNKLSKSTKIICVTGTNGKTTTCALIEHQLKSENVTYFINKSGANMLSGVATAFIMNSNIFGKCKKEYAILECDENSFPLIARYIDADIVVVTNLFRDQLDRYGEITFTLNKIKQAISLMPNATLVLNGDCPITMSISKEFSNYSMSFGINANTNDNTVSDSKFCPMCGCKLKYKSKVFAQLGNFYCTNCGYKHTTPDCYVSELLCVSQFSSQFVMNINHKSQLVKTQLGGIYNIYNFICATLTLNCLGFSDFKSLSQFSGAFGRMENFTFNGHNIMLLLVKNPVGLSQCINYVSTIKNKFDFAFALNDNEADSTDVSWIWDASFEPLKNKTNHVFTVGKRSEDIALRLKYDDLDVYQIIKGENYNYLIDLIKSSSSDFVVMATYTSMMKMRHTFIKEFGGKEFWK